MHENLKAKLLKLIKEKPHNYGQCCESMAYSVLKEEILKAVPILNSEEYDFKTRIFWILNDIQDFPICYICNEKITRNIYTLKTGYNKYKNWEPDDLFKLACNKQQCRTLKKVADTKETCLKKYGTENVFQTDWCKEKITATCLKNSGCIRSGNSKIGREKAKQTCLKNYGVDSPLKSDIVKQKIYDTNLKKYGVSSFTKTEEYRKNIAVSNLSKMLDKIKKRPGS